MVHPKVVIIGAGIVGCALADELAARDVHDITVVEQGPWPRPGGSTSHAPGLVFQTNPSETMMRFAATTLERLDGLSYDGLACSTRVGSLEVATTADRWAELERRGHWARGRGLEADLIDGTEAARRHVLIDPTRILGALFVPTDAWVRPYHAAAALLARSGATLRAETTVTGIEVAGGAVRGVSTDRGRLDADVVVCCAGIWGPAIGRLAGVAIPLQPMAHQYAITGPLPRLCGPGRDPDAAEVRQPILRHQGARLYFREHGARLGIGSYAHRPLPIDVEAIGEGAVGMPSVLPFTPDDFASSWADALDLLPDLSTAAPVEGINGIFSFTADGAPLLGQAPELDGFWVAEAVWITHSVGAARAVAEGICGDIPGVDLHECELNRFEPAMLSTAAVLRGATARFVEVYDAIHPLQPPQESRPLRASPFYHREVEAGAEMLVGNGWERPQWYGVNAGLATADDGGATRDSWSSRYWSPAVAVEHRAVRSGAGLFDMTSLRRLEVTGPDSLTLLDRLTTTKMDKKPGSVSYSLMLDHHGGIRSDITVARLDEHRFWVGTNGPADQAWIDAHRRDLRGVEVRDVTAAVCCLGLWGPQSAAILGPLADGDVDFPYFTCRRLHIGDVPVTALRVSYVGEFGWELYTGADYGQRLWDLLAPSRTGVVLAGRSALDSLRIEKGYRSWGRDMTTTDSPTEAGLEWAVDLKLDFVGRDALDWRTSTRRLRTLVFDDPTCVVLGGETVYAMGAPVGSVTSAAYGYSIGRAVAYAWLPAQYAPDDEVEIGWFGERLAARVGADTQWDPSGRRVRSAGEARTIETAS